MRRIDVLLRGRHRCVGMVLDPAVSGIDVSQRRVLAQWTAISELFVLPDERWFFRFGETVELDSEKASGLLVIEQGSGLATAPLLDPDQGTLTTWRGGVEHSIRLSELDRIDPSIWIYIAEPVEVLTMPVRPATPAIVERPEVVEPDLRSAAKIGKAAALAAQIANELDKQKQAQKDRSRRKSGGGRQSGVAAQAHNKPSNGMFAKLAMKTPVNGFVGRKHGKYLRELENKFTSGDFGEALRHAIPIGGGGGGGLSLRLPGRRQHLRLSGGSTGGGSVPYDITVQAHLMKMYRAAAEELEANGRVDEAAFVLSELLNSATEAVALLERNKRYKTAAELAEARKLDNALIVRLWWLAGDRQRAMGLGRRGEAYAQLVKHLHDVDPEGAREFRMLWVDQLERSGDLHGAIAVGWQDPQIRALLLNPIRRGIAAADRWSLGLRVYLVALQPSTENREALMHGLADAGVSGDARRFAAQVLSDVEIPDPVVDRQICSTALRTLIQLPSETTGFARDRIRDRSDPILASDLPAQPDVKRGNSTVEIPLVPPGARQVLDAVPLTNGSVLLALGEAGVRLVNAAGRTVGEWSTPCHALVASDHDKSALLLTRRGSIVDTYVLDLLTRKTRSYGAILTGLWATSFDGATWVVVDKNGRMAFFDVLADSPTVVWRELDTGSVCHRLKRSDDSLAAIVEISGSAAFPEPQTQIWRWEMPKRRLDVRRKVDSAEGATWVDLLANGTTLWGRPDAPVLVVDRSGQVIDDSRLAADVSVEVSQDTVCLATTEGFLNVVTMANQGSKPVATWQVEQDAGWGIRSQGNLLALWTTQGAVAIVDSYQRELLSIVTAAG